MDEIRERADMAPAEPGEKKKTTLKLIITGRPITKKNHQNIYRSPKTGKPYVTPSNEYKLFAQRAMWELPHPDEPIKEKVNVKCLYYMPTRHRCDLCNLLEATCDVLTEAGIIEDDNSNIVGSHDGSRVLYDKDNPRTEIYISAYED